jgi:hypothetical protein
MIESTDDMVVVEFSYKQDGTKCEGVKLMHCADGEEEKYMKKIDRRMKDLKILKKQRKYKNKL